jgi:hypothetical protein
LMLSRAAKRLLRLRLSRTSKVNRSINHSRSYVVLLRWLLR